MERRPRSPERHKGLGDRLETLAQKLTLDWPDILTIPTPEEVRTRAIEIAATPGFSFPTPEEVVAMKAALGIA